MYEDATHNVTPTTRRPLWPWLLVALLVAWSARDSLPRLIHGPIVPRTVTARDLAEDEKATIELYEAASASVVHVSPIARRFNPFNRRVSEVEAGTGSGFLWDDNGHVVTNWHVVAEADRVVVTLFDGSTWDGAIVGASADKDVAVVRIDAPPHKLRPIPIGTSKDLRVGQKVFAIGNPFGLDFTLTSGVVSALDRDIQALNGRLIHGVIQTDAAINPGNSGGPLLDSAGRLVGINTAIYSPSGASSGIGFAVPVDAVNDVGPQIIAHGRVIRPGLGVQISTDPDFHRRFGLQSGVLITGVMEGGPAQRAGLEGVRLLADRTYVGHVIVGLDDQPITSPDELLVALEGHEVGDNVIVKFRRQNLATQNYEEDSVEVTLQALE